MREASFLRELGRIRTGIFNQRTRPHGNRIDMGGACPGSIHWRSVRGSRFCGSSFCGRDFSPDAPAFRTPSQRPLRLKPFPQKRVDKTSSCNAVTRGLNMADRFSSTTEFLQRLKQRKWLQRAPTCITAAFALVRGINVVAQCFGWPDPIERFIIVALAIGLFSATLIAVHAMASTMTDSAKAAPTARYTP
jgi:hypothetical protein